MGASTTRRKSQTGFCFPTEIARLKEKIQELEAVNRSLGETNSAKDQALRKLEERLTVASSVAREITHLLNEKEEEDSEDSDFDSDSEDQDQAHDEDDGEDSMDEGEAKGGRS